jgi:hypothetical protein
MSFDFIESWNLEKGVVKKAQNTIKIAQDAILFSVTQGSYFYYLYSGYTI